MSNHYRMERGWMDHPAFTNEPHTRRTAWLWLIENANRSDGIANAAGRTVTVGRGQLCRSIRDLAREWKWSASRVDRYLDRLQQDGLVDVVGGHGVNVITIQDYDIHVEPPAVVAEAKVVAISDRLPGIERPPPVDTLFTEWWQHVPRKVGRGQAFKAYRAALRHATPVELLSGIQRYKAEVCGVDPQFIKHPATWLNGHCWADEPYFTRVARRS